MAGQLTSVQERVATVEGQAGATQGQVSLLEAGVGALQSGKADRGTVDGLAASKASKTTVESLTTVVNGLKTSKDAAARHVTCTCHDKNDHIIV